MQKQLLTFPPRRRRDPSTNRAFSVSTLELTFLLLLFPLQKASSSLLSLLPIPPPPSFSPFSQEEEEEQDYPLRRRRRQSSRREGGGPPPPYGSVCTFPSLFVRGTFRESPRLGRGAEAPSSLALGGVIAGRHDTSCRCQFFYLHRGRMGRDRKVEERVCMGERSPYAPFAVRRVGIRQLGWYFVQVLDGIH